MSPYLIMVLVGLSSVQGQVWSDGAVAGKEGDLQMTIRLQSARLTESTLGSKTEEANGCLKRMLCAIGVMKSTITDANRNVFPEVSLGRGIEDFKTILDRMVADIKRSETYTAEEFPNIFQTVASYTVGKATANHVMCDNVFKCSSSGQDMITEAMKSPKVDGTGLGKYAPFMGQQRRQGRVTCKATNVLCPGVSIGCALCGMFKVQNCGQQCVIAGMYCGVSGYACQVSSDTPRSSDLEFF